MGLSKKPSSQNPLQTWEDLDRVLQSQFKLAAKDNKHFYFVNPDIYEMTEEEIISEGTKQGYKVTRVNGQLKFE